MNEPEQAQAIADFKGFVQSNYTTYIPAQITEAIKLLDSQAQKIAEQAKEIERLKSQYSHIVQTNRQRG